MILFPDGRIDKAILGCKVYRVHINIYIYESFATVGEIRVYWRADFQSGSRVLKKVF